MLNKVKTIYHTDNFAFFIRYLAVFTLIFVLMTTLIFQVMRSTMYRSTDETIQKVVTEPQIALHFAIARSYSPDAEFVFEQEVYNANETAGTRQKEAIDSVAGITKASKLHLGTNCHVLLYDEEGTLLNPDYYTGLSEQPLDKKSLKAIGETVIQNPFGGEDDYRYMTMSLTEDDLGVYADYHIRYASIMVNVSQINHSITSYESTILFVMIAFWLISIIASIYLSNLSMRPILASYQKQKDFVENASHELRTPLAVLQNQLENLFRHPELTIMESSEKIASSLTEVRNMRLLTTNLLNLARRDEELKPQFVEVEPSYFDEIFENYKIIAEDNCKNLIAKNHLAFPIRTDKLLIKQLLTILFDNAMKYTDTDGEIRIEVELRDKHVFFRVLDNGIGISNSDKERVFERFYRVDKARTRQNGGFGLGLSLAKQIIHSLRGDITVADNSPQGTIFECKIPKQ